MSDKLIPQKQVDQAYKELEALLAARFPCPYSDDPEHPDSRVQLQLTNLSTHEHMAFIAVRRRDNVVAMSDEEVMHIRDTLMYNLSIAYRELDMFHRLEKLRLDNKP